MKAKEAEIHQVDNGSTVHGTLPRHIVKPLKEKAPPPQ
jgi:hypothetical protein